MKTQLQEGFPDVFEQTKAKNYWIKNMRPELAAKIVYFVDEFRSHHEANGSKFDSWSAAWRTWYIRAIRFSGPAKAKVQPRGGVAFRALPPDETNVSQKMLHDLALKLRNPTP